MIDLIDRQPARHAASWRCCSPAIAAVATVLTLAMPLLATDSLAKRMKAVALEREKMRQRERERLARGEKVVAAPVAEAVHADDRRAVQPEQVARPGGGARAAGAGRLSRPGALRHLPVLPPGDAGRRARCSRCSTCSSCSSSTSRRRSRSASASAPTYVGMQLPLLFLKNKIAKRQLSIKRAFPDALDLLLICVESGMSIEAAFKKVSARRSARSRSRWPRS